MALNLNKGGEENSKPSTEKKSINLSKSGDTQKAGLNLGKEDTVAKELNSAVSEVNESSPKKKNPVIFILLAVVVVGVGIFLFLNKDATSPEQKSTINSDNVVSTSSDQTEPSASPENTPNNEEQEKSVNSSTAVSSDSSVSSSPESNVSASSNNVTKSNYPESSNSTPSKNQSATSTSAPSAITPVGSIDEKVNQVLRGNFGNGLERKRALGDEYAIIQAKVNELYRNKNN
ncbi:MAG: hypothetical protein K9G42_01240 [Pedobacter sp.]|nr:hypothetical protein [Pedobacter sp.]